MESHDALGKRPAVFPIEANPILSTRNPKALSALALTLAAALGLAAWAQVDGERGIAPVAASTDIDVGGIEVNVTGDNADDARAKGWEEATRLAWEKIDGPKLPGSQLRQMVSSIVIEREQIGPKRYVARLGVIFDRRRASRYMGGEAQARASAPMLLIPVTFSAGGQLVYETRNPWQRAWAEFQPGASRVSYVRPSGAGGESLLVNYGQTGRRSRTWWRNVLDQFEAADVIVPIARLRHTYPGGPVEGTFTARYGPDNTYLDSFEMTAQTPDALPDMLAKAVQRFDDIYEQAVEDGKLRPNPTLNLGTPEIDPSLRRLADIGRAVQAQERAAADAARAAEQEPSPGDAGETPAAPPAPVANTIVVVQFASPDAQTFDQTIAAVRGAPGVRGAATRSTAIGGTSVLSVTYGGSIDQLAAALRARGYTVRQGNGALAISR